MMKKQLQRGFTLVEIAIVLVIIGLLLGGALKGQELINNAKIKRIKADFDQVTAAYYTYLDRYRAAPGDDANADDRFGYGDGNNDGNGDGVIGGGATSAAGSDNETRHIWRHLRDAGLITGADDAFPTNAMGGVITVENNAANFGSLGVCFSQVPADMATVIDTSYDDGDGTTGTIRGTVAGVANDAGLAYDAANYAMLCFRL